MSSRPGWAQFLVALSPLALVLVAYAAAHWVNAPLSSGSLRDDLANRIGQTPRLTELVEADRRLFGTIPTSGRQSRFAAPTAQWYDAVFAVTYVSHYVALPAVTVFVWFRHRRRYRAWVACVLGLTAVGMACYVLYPAAPPWLVAQLGGMPPVLRLSDAGWSFLHLEGVASALGATQNSSNPVAAMPSLHAAVPVLVTLFLWPVLRWRSRALWTGYALVMGVGLVYSAEHFVVDVLAGAAIAALVVLKVTWARNRIQSSTDPGSAW